MSHLVSVLFVLIIMKSLNRINSYLKSNQLELGRFEIVIKYE